MKIFLIFILFEKKRKYTKIIVQKLIKKFNSYLLMSKGKLDEDLKRNEKQTEESLLKDFLYVRYYKIYYLNIFFKCFKVIKKIKFLYDQEQ